MRNTFRSRLLRILLIILLVLGAYQVSSAQAKHLAPNLRTGRQSGPPDVLEDCCFQKLLSNEHVRVLRLRMTPHQSTAVDRRLRDYLIIPLDYAQMQTVGPSGNSFDFEMRAGQMQVIKGGWPHRTLNTGDTALDVLEFEITGGIKPEQAVCGLAGKECADGAFGKDQGGTYESATLFETPTLKLRKIELGPGGTLPEHHHRGGQLLIASSAADLSNDMGAGGTSTVHLNPGEVQWLVAGMEHSIHNTSKDAAKFYELELR
jgi:mannose-6-phosphate isomerase-like protein (cupin superfamily)